MRTQAIKGPVDLNVRLTPCSSEGGPPREHSLESFPFTVGRNDTCDLWIDSGRVSREHAVLTYDGGVFRIRDLGSTNGTYVNGRAVDDGVLHDGDVVVFADVEFTFSTGEESSRGATATQVLDLHAERAASPLAPERANDGSSSAWIDLLRASQERLLRRAVRPAFRPLIEPSSQRVVGHEAVASGEDVRATGVRTLPLDDESRLAGSLRQLQRLLALEEALAADAEMIVLHLAAVEMGCDRLHGSLAALRRVLSAESVGRCVMAIPDGAISDTTYVADLHAWLRREGFRILHDGFAGPAAQLAHRAGLRPDFVKLPPPMTRGIDLHPRRQQQVESLIETAAGFGARVATSELVAEGEWAVCRGLAIAFVQGSATADGSARMRRPVANGAPNVA